MGLFSFARSVLRGARDEALSAHFLLAQRFFDSYIHAVCALLQKTAASDSLSKKSLIWLLVVILGNAIEEFTTGCVGHVALTYDVTIRKPGGADVNVTPQ